MNQTHISPSGQAKWAKVFSPNMKFISDKKPHGTYEVDLILTENEAKPLISLLTDMDNANYAQVANNALKKHREKAQGRKDTFKDGLDFAKKKGIERNPLPFKPELDESLEKTGNIVFKFKEDAKWVRKSDGQEWDMKPKVVNAKNKKWDAGIEIGNGSTIKVAYEVSPYYATATGVTLKLRGLQVITLVEYGGGSGSASALFNEEEGEDIGAEEVADQVSEMFAEQSAEDVPF